MEQQNEDERFTRLRLDMVQRQIRERGIRDDRLLSALERVPRHLFLDEEHWDEAYEDHPVPIANMQTVSQPFMVAEMLRLMELRQTDVVLEVGTGTGYQAALLGELAARVYTVERHAELAATARHNLSRLGYENVTVITGDGSRGLPQYAPFDSIVVAAASPQVPQPLVKQLREGGRLVIPVGPANMQLLEVVRNVNGEALVSTFDRCTFVPLIGEGM
jgi:protein-L-isoaspartate(D-aspartate) O-methyltransferase